MTRRQYASSQLPFRLGEVTCWLIENGVEVGSDEADDGGNGAEFSPGPSLLGEA